MEPTFKPLRAFADSRGYSYFDIFGEPTSGQINIGNLAGPAIKAFHYHKLQWDHWFCLKGDIHVVIARPKEIWKRVLKDYNDYMDAIINNEPVFTHLKDDDIDSMDIRHFYIGEHNPGVLSIPPGWWHGYCNVSQDSSLLYWVTKPYDPKNPDEYRIPWDVFGENFWKPENK